MSSRLIAQMKADSSRAIAVTITVRRLPFRSSERKRPHNLVCAFHAISRARLGAASTFGCLSRLTRGGYGSLGVVLVCLRIAEVDEHAVAHVLCNESFEPAHSTGNTRLIGRNDLTQILWVQTCGERRRTDKVRKHHGDLAALGRILGSFVPYQWSVDYCRWCSSLGVQPLDSVEQLTA